MMAAATAVPPAHTDAEPPAVYSTRRALASPVCVKGPVVHGFKRGSKELGIPTANLEVDALGGAVDALDAGVYYGWASVGDSDAVYKMVMSIGWNPYYGNTKKTVEPHLLHAFDKDFYGEELRLAITGYLRPEMNFTSLDALVDAIRTDIRLAGESLDVPPHTELKALADLRPTPSKQ